MLLERICDLLSADDFRALAKAYPGVQIIFIPSTEKRASTCQKLRQVLGDEKANLLMETWGGTTISIPAVYLRSPEASPAMLYHELVERSRTVSEIASEYKIHPTQILQLVAQEARRIRDAEIIKSWGKESTPQLSRRLGVPQNQIRSLICHHRDKFPQDEPHKQLTLLGAS